MESSVLQWPVVEASLSGVHGQSGGGEYRGAEEVATVELEVEESRRAVRSVRNLELKGWPDHTCLMLGAAFGSVQLQAPSLSVLNGKSFFFFGPPLECV